MTRRTLIQALVVSAVIVGPGVALAQSVTTSQFARDRNVTVRERNRPDYEALGIHAGGFLVFPRLGLDVVSDDNIFATQNNEVNDVIWRVRPELTVNSNWNRHALSVFARAQVNRYADHSSEDTTDYTVGAKGRLDIGVQSSLTANATHQYLTEPRTATTAPGAAAKPVRFYLDQAVVTGVHEFNRLRVTGRLNYGEYDYRNVAATNGGVLLQDFRDRTQWSETGRVDYAISPATAVYVTATANQRNYRLSPPTVSSNKDSDGYEASVGVNFELSALMRGEIDVGYLSQSYDDPAFKDIDGMSLHAAVDWFPTELTTVNFTASRSVEEAVVAGGYLSTNVGARVDHELLRNVLLSANAGYSHDDYEGVDRTDKTKSAGLGVTYLLNRNVGVSGAYNYLDRDSKGISRNPSFTDNKLTATLTLQF